MKNLKDYFEQLRKRPGMYMSGKDSISSLFDHLQGYRMACFNNDIKNVIDTQFFENFNDFVDNHYNTARNNNWKGVILEQCDENEELAIRTFFELFDIFASRMSQHSS
jgi:hypothetical protein